jgi:hypothetical protein
VLFRSISISGAGGDIPSIIANKDKSVAITADTPCIGRKGRGRRNIPGIIAIRNRAIPIAIATDTSSTVVRKNIPGIIARGNRAGAKSAYTSGEGVRRNISGIITIIY